MPTESDRTLRRRCRWVDVSGWPIDEYGTTKGNRTKFVAYPDGRFAPIRRRPYRYYWKESLARYPIEFWSEVLAYHVGAVVGVAVPPCFPATFDVRVGSLSLSLVNNPDEELVHGGDLISQVAPNYDRQKGEEHSVQLVLEALKSRIGDNSLYRDLFRQFVLDALIGNQDRHQDNWGVNKSWKLTSLEGRGFGFEYDYRMLPAFDNGSSLGRELTESRVDDLLRDPVRFEAYVRRGRAHIGWYANGQIEHFTHEELMRRHLAAFPKSRIPFEEIIGFSDKAVRRAIARVCRLSRARPELAAEISPAREEFLKRLVQRRGERLRSL